MRFVWNYATIRMGLPASSSHALMGGYGGAAIVAAGFRAILIHGWVLPVLFIFVGPFIGLAAGLLVTVITSWIVYRQAPQKVDKWFRRLQLVSAGAFSLGHGTNDAQKGMGIITAALVTSGTLTKYTVPYWVILCCHLAIAGGTMRRRLARGENHGPEDYQAESVWRICGGNGSCDNLDWNGLAGIPVSTTHVITGAIVGVGASRRLTAVRWGVTERIAWAWVLTIPGAGLMGAAFHFLFLNWVH